MENRTETKKRPVGIWVVCAYVAYCLLSYAFSLFLRVSNALPAAVKAQMANQPAENYRISAAILLVTSLAGLALFMMKKIAIPLFYIDAIFGTAFGAYVILNNPAFAKLADTPMYIPVMVGAAIGILIAVGIKIAIIVYCHVLAKKRILT